MLSKFCSRTLFKTASKAFFPAKQISPLFFRSFASSGPEQAEKMTLKLGKAITKEISFEQENYRPDETVNVITSLLTMSLIFYN